MADKKEEETQAKIIELVLARLDTLPSNARISIGSDVSLTKQELMKHVKNDDEIGKKIVEIQLNYLRFLKEGKIYELPTTN